ncbi:MAG: putative Ig domain-containing protein [Planctomycetota bacterium]|nr:putative Ig domain-containing protein [Planctomycetota bacterium]
MPYSRQSKSHAVNRSSWLKGLLNIADGENASSISDGFSQLRIECLEARQVFAAPSLVAIPNVTVYQGAPLQVPLDGSDADINDTLTYTVTSNNPNLIIERHSGNRSLRIHVKHESSGVNDPAFEGDMVFELFEDLAPETTARIIELAESGFYDGIIFHRVIETFVIQGGDPTGTGSGGSDLGDFDDEFHPDLLHTSVGLLSMAKSSDDTNDSQFFITAGPTRHLDFNHSIFGRLVEGEDIRQKIAKVAVGSGDKPVTPVTMTKVEVFEDKQNEVITLKTAPGATGTAQVTVTVSDGNGGTAQRVFNVTMAADPALQNDTQDSQPYFEPIAPIETTINTPVTVQLPWNDVDGGSAAVFDYNPEGIDPNIEVVIDSATGELTITPKNGVSGVFEIMIGVRDGKSDWDIQEVAIYVKPNAPTIDLASSSDTGSSNTDNLTTRDNSSQAQRLEFLVGNLISGATVQIFADGVLIGQGTASGTTALIATNGTVPLTGGAHAITVKQSLGSREVDVGNLKTTIDLISPPSTALSVTLDKIGPIFSSTPPTSAVQGTALTYNAETDEEPNDQAGTKVTYSLTQSPSGATIHASNGTLQWTPSAAQAGAQVFRIRAVDKAGNETFQQFTVNVNTTPTLAAIPNKAVSEGQLLTFTAQGGDADLPNDTLTYSLLAGFPTGAAIDASTGVFTWTPTAAQGPGTYTISVRVTDSHGSSATQAFSVNVADSAVAPVLGAIGDRNVNEGSQLTINATATDANLPNDTLVYSLENKPVGMTINATTGVVTWTPTEAQGPGSFSVTLRVTDAFGLFDEETFNVTVGEVNIAPVMVPIADQTVNAGGTLAFNVIASDADLPANTLTYSLGAGAPDGATINPSTGAFSWTPSAQQSGGQYSITVLVSDGTNESSQTFDVLVNTPPELAEIADQEVNEGAQLTVSAQGTDDNLNDTLAYSLFGAVPSGAAINQVTGVFTWKPTEAQGPGSYTFNVRVTDSGGLTAERSFTVNVLEVENAPVIAPIGTLIVTQESTLNYQILASDVDLPAEALTYELLDGAPAGAVLNSSTGQLTWATTAADAPGTYSLTVRVTDSTGLSTERTFEVEVQELNLAPVFDPIADQTVDELSTLTIPVQATDNDLTPGSIVYSLGPNQPSGVAIDPVTGLLTWTPTEGHGPATYMLTVVATDSDSLVSSISFNVTVNEVDSAPTLDPVNDVIGLHGTTVQVSVTGKDLDEPAGELVYSIVSGPVGMHINPQTGHIIWPIEMTVPAGAAPVIVRATDPTGLFADVSFNVQVQPSVFATMYDQDRYATTNSANLLLRSSVDIAQPNTSLLIPAVSSESTIPTAPVNTVPVAPSLNRIQAVSSEESAPPADPEAKPAVDENGNPIRTTRRKPVIQSEKDEAEKAKQDLLKKKSVNSETDETTENQDGQRVLQKAAVRPLKRAEASLPPVTADLASRREMIDEALLYLDSPADELADEVLLVTRLANAGQTNLVVPQSTHGVIVASQGSVGTGLMVAEKSAARPVARPNGRAVAATQTPLLVNGSHAPTNALAKSASLSSAEPVAANSESANGKSTTAIAIAATVVAPVVVAEISRSRACFPPPAVANFDRFWESNRRRNSWFSWLFK